MKRVISLFSALVIALSTLSLLAVPTFAVAHDCEDTSGDGLCDFKSGNSVCGEIVDGFTYLKGNSITLADNIIVYFTISIDESASESGNIYAYMTLTDGSESKIPLSSAMKSGEDYVFKAEVAAKELTKDTIITIGFEDYPDFVTYGTEYRFSVRDYCDAYLDKYPTGRYVNIINALKNYGAMAQKYFDYKTDDLIVEEPDISGVTLPSESTVEKSGAVSGISHTSVSLVLEAETIIRHYFTLSGEVSIEDYSFSVGNEPLEVKATDTVGKYYVDITDVSPNELGIKYTVTVTKDAESYSCSYAATDYMIRMASKAGAKEKTVNLCKAMYAYYSEAITLNEQQ